MLATLPQTPNISHATLAFERQSNRTVLTRAYATQPAKLLAPANAGHAAWVYTSTYGGGLLAGDRLMLDIHVAPAATAYISTQSSTKIYRNPNAFPTSQTLSAQIDDAATLIFWPDPLSCFARARYLQRQHFSLAPTASLLLVDAYTSGRHARGERWQAAHFESRNTISVGQVPILNDAMTLAGPHLPARLGHFNCFATLILLGPSFTAASTEALEWIGTQPVTPHADLLFSAGALPTGVIVRVASTSAETATAFLRDRCSFLPTFLGDNPWHRKH